MDYLNAPADLLHIVYDYIGDYLRVTEALTIQVGPKLPTVETLFYCSTTRGYSKVSPGYWFMQYYPPRYAAANTEQCIIIYNIETATTLSQITDLVEVLEPPLLQITSKAGNKSYTKTIDFSISDFKLTSISVNPHCIIINTRRPKTMRERKAFGAIETYLKQEVTNLFNLEMKAQDLWYALVDGRVDLYLSEKELKDYGISLLPSQCLNPVDSWKRISQPYRPQQEDMTINNTFGRKCDSMIDKKGEVITKNYTVAVYKTTIYPEGPIFINEVQYALTNLSPMMYRLIAIIRLKIRSDTNPETEYAPKQLWTDHQQLYVSIMQNLEPLPANSLRCCHVEVTASNAYHLYENTECRLVHLG